MPRTQVAVRMSEGGLSNIDDIAKKTGSNRSKVIRILLAEALGSKDIKESVIDRLGAIKETL